MRLAVPSAEIEAAVRAYRARIVERFGARLRETRLFGSYARGDFGPESDVDLLTVVDDLTREERREIFEIAADLYFDFQRRLSPLALSTAEYHLLRDREYRITAEIDRDGIPL